MGSSSSRDSLDYAAKCVERGIRSREQKDFKAAIRWFEKALEIREAFYSGTTETNYCEPLLAALIYVGEVHFWDSRTDRALYYFLRANDILDPKMDTPSIRQTSAVTQFVNVTAGLVLVYTRVSENDQLDPVNRSLIDVLQGCQPLELAEQQLRRCIAVVTAAEGSRSPTLIPLLHMLARILMSMRRSISALRVMQRCLGLTLHVAQTLQIYSFLSYTRNVLDAVKFCAKKDQAAVRILMWWRKRQSERAADSMQPLASSAAAVGSSTTSPPMRRLSASDEERRPTAPHALPSRPTAAGASPRTRAVAAGGGTASATTPPPVVATGTSAGMSNPLAGAPIPAATASVGRSGATTSASIAASTATANGGGRDLEPSEHSRSDDTVDESVSVSRRADEPKPPPQHNGRGGATDESGSSSLMVVHSQVAADILAAPMEQLEFLPGQTIPSDDRGFTLLPLIEANMKSSAAATQQLPSGLPPRAVRSSARVVAA